MTTANDNWTARAIKASERPLNREDLIAAAIEASEKLSRKDAARIVNAIISKIVHALAHGRIVSLRDFGTFYVRVLKTSGRRLPVPGTDRVTTTRDTIMVRFRPFAHLRSQVSRLTRSSMRTSSHPAWFQPRAPKAATTKEPAFTDPANRSAWVQNRALDSDPEIP